MSFWCSHFWHSGNILALLKISFWCSDFGALQFYFTSYTIAFYKFYIPGSSSPSGVASSSTATSWRSVGSTSASWSRVVLLLVLRRDCLEPWMSLQFGTSWYKMGRVGIKIKIFKDYSILNLNKTDFYLSFRG